MGFVGAPGGMRWKVGGLPRISRMGLKSYRMLSAISGLAGSEVNMFRAKHILLSSRDMAESCQAQVQSGANFADVAKSISQCSSKDRGGDLGWFMAGTMASGFEKACREAAVGDTVVTETEFGWHVIQVNGKAIYPKSMTVQELSELYNNQELLENYQLIDVREVGERQCSPLSRMAGCYESDRCPLRLLHLSQRGEVDIAKLDHFEVLPMSEYEVWADSVENAERFDKSKPTVVMCHHGVRSAQMAYYFAQQGFEDVYNLTGGINAWSMAVDENVPKY
uniref:Peptidyl-prolyl cis-trans isomerase n=1 Tax=Rhodosorus marinus TaxID=101924 RepID=A0A7S0G408_9RHOD|mmetsp:Transcript_17057/g.24474  ORF Transcript_17057/g.24474 Transcript_17057/m.24474 type:complete len:279 (+) Transcript_17057:70-906(+)